MNSKVLVSLLLVLSQVYTQSGMLIASAPDIATSGTISSLVNTVQSARQNQFCPIGSYWNTQTCFLCSQFANGYCSCGMINGCDQIYCLPGYYSNGNTNAPQCLSCGDDNCLQCGVVNLALQCSVCQANSQLIGGVCVPLNGCSTFSLTTAICQTCQPGTYFNWNFPFYTTPSESALYLENFPTQCNDCSISNCNSCDSPNTCNSCTPFYGFAQFQATGSQQGQSNAQNNGLEICQVCSSYCLTCTSNNQQCTQCLQGYYLANAAPSVSSTITSSSTTAATSSPDSTVSSNPSTTPSTTTSSTSSTTTVANDTCWPCNSPLQNCAQCTNATTCTTCQNGFYLTSTGTCVQCGDNCTACDTTNTAVCTSCQPGYILSPTTSTCVACPNYCMQGQCAIDASNNTTCSQCYDTYVQTLTHDCQSCDSLSDNYVRCAANQQAQEVQPTQCSEGFWLVTVDQVNSCIQAIPSANCYTIVPGQDATQCASCMPGYLLVPTTNTCITGVACQNFLCTTQALNTDNTAYECTACQDGLYLASPTLCLPCATVDQNSMRGCTKCSSSSTCTTCSNNGFYSNGQNGCNECTVPFCQTCSSDPTCTACQAGYFLFADQDDNQSCVNCPQNCATCDAPGNGCSTCQTGFVLQGNGCVSLSQGNCLTASGQGCLSCTYGYYLSGEFCVECINPFNAFVCRQTDVVSSSSTSSAKNSTLDSTTSGSPANTTTTPAIAQVITLGLVLVAISLMQ